MRFERIIHSVCADFALRKLLFVRTLHHAMCSLVKTSRMRQSQKVAQQLTWRNAKHQRAHMTRSVHLHKHNVLPVPLNVL